MAINQEELKQKSKSKYGKFEATKPNKIMAVLEKIFLKSSLTKAYINGALTIGAILYWLLEKNALPLLVWFFYNIIVTILAIIYWGWEKKRLKTDIQRCENELQGLSQEITERKAYFDKINDELRKLRN